MQELHSKGRIMSKGVYAAASAMWVEQRSLDVTARNIAHALSPGYRKEVVQRTAFVDELAKRGHGTDLKGDGGAGVLTDGSRHIFTEGSRETTGAPLDLGLAGNGFYQVQAPDGRTLLTRAAHFTTDRQGRMVNPDGWPVLGQGGAISIPPDADRILVDQDGRVSYEVTQDGIRNETVLDQLRIGTVDNPERMRAVNGQYFDPTGQPVRDASNVQVLQGTLEKANIEPVQELVEMIAIQRRFDAAQKALREQSQAGSGFSDILRGG